MAPAVLIVCLAIVTFWQLAAAWARRPWEPFELTWEDFKDFELVSEKWAAKPVQLDKNPYEPNLIAFEVVPKVSLSQTKDEGPRTVFN